LLLKEFSGGSHCLLDNLAWLIVVDDVDNGEWGATSLREENRSLDGCLGTSRKISGCHNVFHHELV
jgi:hypothetical protein